MKKGKGILVSLGALAMALVIGLALSVSTMATPKYAKETSKKCLDCHKKIPKQGDKDAQLTELGQKFKDNDHKLPK
jgi:hypothetical protein